MRSSEIVWCAQVACLLVRFKKGAAYFGEKANPRLLQLSRLHDSATERTEAISLSPPFPLPSLHG